MKPKTTTLIIKAGNWKDATLSANHPEFKAISSVIEQYRSDIRFILVGTSDSKTKGLVLKDGTVAWDIEKEGRLGHSIYYLKLLRIILQYRPRLIIVLGLHSILPVAFYSIFSAKSYYIPVVIGEFGYHGGRKIGKLLFDLGLRVLGIAIELSRKKIVEMYTLSNHTRENLEKLAPSMNKRIGLVSYPIHEAFSSGKRHPKSLQIHEPTILTVAGIEPRKGLDVLIESISILLKRHLVSVKAKIKGSVRDVTYLQNLVRLIDQRGLRDRVSFLTEHIDYERLVEYYRSATIFVLPTRDDCLGVAVLEALCCGTPVIATAVGGIPDMVENGMNGILVEAGNPDQLADAISSVLGDEKLRKKLAVNARSGLERRYYKGRTTLKDALMESVRKALQRAQGDARKRKA